MRPVGWRYESYRHSLDAHRIRTSRWYNVYVPTYGAGDIPLIAGQGVGVAGAEAVSWIPVAVPAACVWCGGDV